MEVKLEGYNPKQLWKFITSSDKTNLLIQNYFEGTSLVLDTTSENQPGQPVQVYDARDGNNQKFYMRI